MGRFSGVSHLAALHMSKNHEQLTVWPEQFWFHNFVGTRSLEFLFLVFVELQKEANVPKRTYQVRLLPGKLHSVLHKSCHLPHDSKKDRPIMHRTGLEPVPEADQYGTWEASILPLNYRC